MKIAEDSRAISSGAAILESGHSVESERIKHLECHPAACNAASSGASARCAKLLKVALVRRPLWIPPKDAAERKPAEYKARTGSPNNGSHPHRPTVVLVRSVRCWLVRKLAAGPFVGRHDEP